MSIQRSILSHAAVPYVPEGESWEPLLASLTGEGRLHAQEADLARSLPAARRATFVAGRLALRDALQQAADQGKVGVDPRDPILRTPRGAPLLPPHVSGSISHKRTLAMAAVMPRDGAIQHVGLDLERRPEMSELARPSVARKILTAGELGALDDHAMRTGRDPLVERERVLVHFALKEAVYKAIDPFVERYVRFTEVELSLHDEEHGGRARVHLHLPELADGRIHVAAQWHLQQEWIVAEAYSTTPSR